MNEEREKVYQILELGKHIKNLHHKKGFGGLLFIDLSMIKFSKLSSYIRQLDKENQELKKQLHEASLTIQEMTEQDIECPSNCEKLRRLKKQLEENKDKINWYENFEINKTIDKLRIKHNNQQKEFISYLENEKDRLARECSHIYENSLGKTRLVNEDIFNEVDTILSKYKSIIGCNKSE